jgi:hypothetical protein
MARKPNTKNVGVVSVVEEHTIDFVTGEMVSQRTATKRFVSKEPDFVKLYLDDVMKLNDIPAKKTDVLYLLLKKMNYDNEITVVASHKREIAKQLSCSIISIDKTLALLVDKGILIRKDRGVFLANPNIFGKGNWKDIEQLRLLLTYDVKGKHIESGISNTLSITSGTRSLFDSKQHEKVQSDSKSIEQ